MHPAEGGVALAVDLLDRGPAALQQAADVALGRSVHRLVQDLQSGRLHGFEREHPRDLGGVGGVGVEDLDQAPTLPLLEAQLLHPSGALHVLDLLLQAVGHLGGGRAGVLRLVLEPAEVVGVVAGGDDQAAARLALQDGVGGDLRGAGSVDLEGPHAVGGQHLRHLASESLGGEAGVVADDGGRVRALAEILRDPLGGLPHRLVGEVVGDDPAPAVGAEPDLHRGYPTRALRSCRWSSARRPAASRSAASISRTRSSKLVFGRQPSRARALPASPRRSGTSAGRI